MQILVPQSYVPLPLHGSHSVLGELQPGTVISGVFIHSGDDDATSEVAVAAAKSKPRKVGALNSKRALLAEIVQSCSV